MSIGNSSTDKAGRITVVKRFTFAGVWLVEFRHWLVEKFGAYDGSLINQDR